MVNHCFWFLRRKQHTFPAILVAFLVINTVILVSITTPYRYPANVTIPINISAKTTSPKFDEESELEFGNSSNKFPEVPPIQEGLIKFLYTPKIACNASSAPDILIIVHSYVKNFEHRKVIRNTIGKHDKYNGLVTRIIFVTGENSTKDVAEKLDAESSLHGDLLVISVIDKYTRMVYKAIGWMKWISTSCEGIKHIIKMDDDTFLHMYQISKLYKSCNSSSSASPICDKMSCLLWKNFRPHRKGKYSLSMSEYSRASFPPFCPGVVIFIPGSMIERLLHASRHVQFLWLDDVYLTGLLMEYLGEEHYNFGDKILSTLLKNYKSIDSGKMYVGHFNKDVLNGKYEKHWKKIESQYR